MTHRFSARMLGLARTAGAEAGGALVVAMLAGGVVGACGVGCSSSSDAEKKEAALSPAAFRVEAAPSPSPVAAKPSGSVVGASTSAPADAGAGEVVVVPASAVVPPFPPAPPPIAPSAPVSVTTPPPPPLTPAASEVREKKVESARRGGEVVVPMQDGVGVVAVVDQSPSNAARGVANVSGRDVLADCMVGQINGRPVFASEVLDPMDGKLRVDAQGVRNAETAFKWKNDTANLIQSEVARRVRDELLLGEARARLTPEQKQGLIYFLQRVDQWASGREGGSREEAARNIEASEGMSYEKFLETQRDKTLIQELVKENVSPRVRVPWRKVERFYAENQDLINPEPRAVVQVLMVDGKNAALVERAQAAASAADGKAYAELAASNSNMYRQADAITGRTVEAGRLWRTLPSGGAYGDLQWFGNPSLNTAAAALQPGQASPAMDLVGDKVWVRREADVHYPRKTLEDVQLEIVTGLLKVKENQEQADFFMELLGNGSFTPISRMTRELLVLAAQRHLPPEIAALVRDANPVVDDHAPGGALQRSPAPPVLNDAGVLPVKGKP